jgi:precorrin-3B C17-methyltransferase
VEGVLLKIYAVGLGPGDPGYLAPRAKEVILASDVVAGYTGYLELISQFLINKEIINTGMKGEVERCQAAIAEAFKGKQVCVVSSGDAGIYGMAALLYELAALHDTLEIEVIPGITAASSAAAILGSPLTNDYAVISLSDLLTPWDVIEKRLDACSSADMVICFYNPQSKKRSNYLERACEIVSRHKPPQTNCGYVRNAFRADDEESNICILAELPKAPVDMLTTVIIGNSDTRVINRKLVTVRGYRA